jgi:ATP-dependent helicase HrpB
MPGVDAKLPDLPMVAALPELSTALATNVRVIVEAPPGAGKSTLVPLHLLDADWTHGQRIVLLEPRRVAARAVAARMAALLREPLGATVGFRTRLERVIGPDTRVEVITEGILTRTLQSDPSLEGIACVIFDEFHERSLQADLGLALCLDVQEHLRPDLRLLVMSATLDGARLTELLREPVTVRATGRQYAVETHWIAPAPYLRAPAEQLGRRVANAAAAALACHDGDLLAFLPGAAEIRRAAEKLASGLPAGVDVLPLYGELGAAAQDAALRPAPPGRRKLILATNLAETSLTIEGVRIVIDSGYERRPRFDLTTAMNRLETVRISHASAEQRRGRAGRTAPGVCYRLWTEASERSLLPQTPPEILETDLAPLALELAEWGCADPQELRWLDPPPAAAFGQARDLLHDLEALDEQRRLTAAGRSMSGLGVHPRLAHMILRGARLGHLTLAVRIAALLSERDILRGVGHERDPDLRIRLDALGDAGPRTAAFDAHAVQRVRQAVTQISRRARSLPTHDQASRAALAEDDATGLLLAFAYPDRIGRLRDGRVGQYLLSGGRGAQLPESAALARSEFIVAATLDAGAADARIQLAAPLRRELIDEHLGAAIEDVEVVSWDTRTSAVLAQHERRLGALRLEVAALRTPPAYALAREMIRGIRQLGLTALPWTPDLRQWCARVELLRGVEPDVTPAWPNVSEAALLEALDTWLSPWLERASRREHLARIDLRAALRSLLHGKQPARLETLAPTHYAVPSGSRIAIDYTEGNPMIAVRLQEVFGLLQSPTIVAGRIALTLQLLSPAQRPVQVTRDLASFWRSGYAEVRRELKGRYPKHYWPEDPLQATATRRVRPG